MMEYRPSLRRKCSGWSLIVISPIGGILPVVPGVVFFALGLFVLRHQYFWAHRSLRWVDQRWPTMVAKVETMEARSILRAKATGLRLRAAAGRVLRRT